MDDYLNFLKYNSDDKIYASSTLCKWDSIKQHWHNFYEIEFICEGEGIININGEDFPFKSGTLHIFVSHLLVFGDTHSADLNDLTPDLYRQNLPGGRGTGPGLIPFHIQYDIVHISVTSK